MKFTQEELEKAWDQMREEREKEVNDAYQAAKWLKEKIDIKVRGCDCTVERPDNVDGPYPIKYLLVIIIGSDIQTDRYIEVLDNLTFVEKLEDWKYQVYSPFGMFDLTFRDCEDFYGYGY